MSKAQGKEPSRRSHAKEPSRQIVEVPLLPSAGRNLLVAATVNGNVPVTFIFDTGAFFFLISDTLAAKLKAQPDPAYQKYTIDANGYSGIWITQLQELSVGALKIAGPSAAVGTDKLFKVNPDVPAEFEGFIGASSMRQMKLAVAIYPRTAKLKFFRPGNLSASARKAAGFGSRAFVVPLVWKAEEFLYKCQVTLTQGDKTWTGPLLLDTGSAQTIIPTEAAQQLGLTATSAGKVFGLGGSAVLSGAPVAGLSVGNLLGAPVERVFYPSPDIKWGKWGEVLGMDVLGHYNLLIDFATDKLYLAPLEEKDAEHR